MKGRMWGLLVALGGPADLGRRSLRQRQSCGSEVCQFLAVWRPGQGQYLGPRPGFTWMAVFLHGRGRGS